ncbi:MAG: hypothetical protein FJ265_20780, partial [Planctomycetes bacterium]|nr:hypothetical protein [Planctomycetota bacterium]
VAPQALELDEHRTCARAGFDGLAGLGLFGLCVAEANGGAGMGFLPYVASLEALGACGGSLARLLIGQVQAALALEAAGDGALEAVVGGSSLATFAGPEHGLELAAGQLRGRAELVAGGAAADLVVVAASGAAGPALAVVEPAGCERSDLRALGLRSAGPAAVTFRGPARVVAEGAAARQAIDRAELAAWLGVAAGCCGGGAACVQIGRRHAAERIAFGKPLLAQEAVVRKLVETQRAVDAAQHLTWHAARLHDLGQDGAAAALAARIAAVDALVAAADEAIQILGGYGYTVEYHVERHYRDGKTLEVLDGGSERLRDRLGRLWFG